MYISIYTCIPSPHPFSVSLMHTYIHPYLYTLTNRSSELRELLLATAEITQNATHSHHTHPHSPPPLFRFLSLSLSHSLSLPLSLSLSLFLSLSSSLCLSQVKLVPEELRELSFANAGIQKDVTKLFILEKKWPALDRSVSFVRVCVCVCVCVCVSKSAMSLR